MSTQDNYDKGRGPHKPGKNARKKTVARKNASVKLDSYNKKEDKHQDPTKPKLKFDKTGKEIGRREKPTVQIVKKSNPEDGIRLNKYIANSGVCSRREADRSEEHTSELQSREN